MLYVENFEARQTGNISQNCQPIEIQKVVAEKSNISFLLFQMGETKFTFS